MREYHEIKHDTYFFALPMECSLHTLPNEFITSGKGGEVIDMGGPRARITSNILTAYARFKCVIMRES